MKSGIGSYTLPWAIGHSGIIPERPLDAFGLLQLAISHRLQVVQYCDNLSLLSISTLDLDRLFGQAADNGVQIEVGGRGLDEIEPLAAIALRVETDFVRIVIDRGKDEPSVSEAIVRLKLLSAKLADVGLKIGVENHDRFRASEFLEIVHEANVGIVLDTANSLGSLEGPVEVVRILDPHVLSLHIKDVRCVREPHSLGFRVVGTPAGQGSVPIPEIMSPLDSSISAILEHWMAPGAGDEIEWLDQSLKYLNLMPGWQING